MADRGQITGGPLTIDNAIDAEAAKIKGINSPVAGRAQILIVPDLDAGNMLAKNLIFLVKADAAGIRAWGAGADNFDLPCRFRSRLYGLMRCRSALRQRASPQAGLAWSLTV
jgi:Phosphate acetyl/butaryl transferase